MSSEQVFDGGADCIGQCFCAACCCGEPCGGGGGPDVLNDARLHEPFAPRCALCGARADGDKIKLQLGDQCVCVAAVVGGDHGCLAVVGIPSAVASSLPRRAGAGGVGSSCHKKNPASAGTPHKKHPRCAPRSRAGSTGVFAGFQAGRIFHHVAMGGSGRHAIAKRQGVADWRDCCLPMRLVATAVVLAVGPWVAMRLWPSRRAAVGASLRRAEGRAKRGLNLLIEHISTWGVANPGRLARA